jgi:hypothetical protein
MLWEMNTAAAPEVMWLTLQAAIAALINVHSMDCHEAESRRQAVGGKRSILHVLFDTNFWKSFVLARLVVAQGDPGCLSLFEERPESHRLFAEHLTSEYRIRTEGRGRTVDEWQIRPEQADNHWFDGVVGCALAAATQGCVLFGTDDSRTQMRPLLVKLSDLKRGRRAWEINSKRMLRFGI